MSKYHQNPVSNVSSLTLSVTNLNISKEFYTKVLGLTVLFEDDSHISFGGDKVILTIIEDPNLDKNKQQLGLYHFALLLPNRKSFADLFKRLISFEYPLTGLSDHMVSEAIYLDDPDGNGIELFYDKSPEGWVLDVNGMPIMTRPVDSNKLYQEASSNYLNPLPTNVIMGHLHLHVENLEKANHFFVELLGFQTTLKLRGSAQFISDIGYHHHIAFNLWSRTKEVNQKAPGLIDYTITVSANNYQLIKSRLELDEYLYDEKIKNNELVLNDMNNTKVIIKVY